MTFEQEVTVYLQRRAYRPGQPVGINFNDLLGHAASHVLGNADPELTRIFALATPGQMDTFRSQHPQAAHMMTERLSMLEAE